MGIMHRELKKNEAILKGLLEKQYEPRRLEETGTIMTIDSGVGVMGGLEKIRNEELISFPGGTKAIAYNLDPGRIGFILLGDYQHLQAGDQGIRTFSVASIPVSEAYLGRVITPLGEPMDEKGPVDAVHSFPMERKARPIMHRDPVVRPLQTGIKVIDSVVPIGKGQRELILGDRQTGKTAIAIDTILNQKDKNVVCIYCAIGQQASTVAKIIETLKQREALSYTIVMVANPDDPPGVSYLAPYAATSLGEFFMEKGRDVLVVYDDLTRHARAYREISLLLERPPGREAYPGDIFFIHSRLLERSTQLRKEYGGGSMTALPIIETQGENLSAYIPTNLISITDGQIYVSPKLFQRGNMPAVNIGQSVSRVGGKTQLAAYRKITSDLKLTYSQFEELEAFASFGTRLDESTRATLERGKRIRMVLNQPENQPMEVSEQIGVLLAVTSGIMDEIPLEKIPEAENLIREMIRHEEDFSETIRTGYVLSEEQKKLFLDKISEKLKSW